MYNDKLTTLIGPYAITIDHCSSKFLLHMKNGLHIEKRLKMLTGKLLDATIFGTVMNYVSNNNY